MKLKCFIDLVTDLQTDWLWPASSKVAFATKNMQDVWRFCFIDHRTDDNFILFPNSAMQTLDRRISASSDQLDTMKKQKNRQKPFRTRSSSRLSYERKFDTEEAEFKVPTFHQKPNKELSREVTKTPFEIFLEDDGPYSRKLYGPVTPKPCLDRGRERQSQKNQSKFVGGFNKLRREKLVYTPAETFREKVRAVRQKHRDKPGEPIHPSDPPKFITVRCEEWSVVTGLSTQHLILAACQQEEWDKSVWNWLPQLRSCGRCISENKGRELSHFIYNYGGCGWAGLVVYTTDYC